MITGKDLIAAGLEPGRSFAEAIAAANLALTGDASLEAAMAEAARCPGTPVAERFLNIMSTGPRAKRLGPAAFRDACLPKESAVEA